MVCSASVACLVLLVIVVSYLVLSRGAEHQPFSGSAGGHGRAPLGGGSHLPTGSTYMEKGQHELALLEDERARYA